MSRIDHRAPRCEPWGSWPGAGRKSASRGAVRRYDAVFVGGGLSALSFLGELAGDSPPRFAIVDPVHPHERPPVHWSYWSSEPTPYDRFALGAWHRANVRGGRSEEISPFTLRLVRSTEVFARLVEELRPMPIEWIQAPARSIGRKPEALVKSASFGPRPVKESPEPLLEYLQERYPAARFEVISAEYGSIPLGFAPRETTGPRHILLGAKRGLVKPSAGYGVANIARESEHLARLWREGSPLPPSRRPQRRWRALDASFLRLAARDPRLPMLLLDRVMRGVPLPHSLSFIDETLEPRRLLQLAAVALPTILSSR